MRRVLGLSLVLAGIVAGVAGAQPAAAPAPGVVFGETAMVVEPCLPVPKALADWVAGPPGAPLSGEALKAYGPWNAWMAANDWPGLCRYQEANREAMAEPHPRVVFMGDSITENWRRFHPAFFTESRIGRGISGQTTPQMVARFYQDVVALHPQVVHVMAGTNDIAGNTGPTTEERYKANIAAMTDLARANGIAVVLASIPPSSSFGWRPALKPAAEIRKLNAWLAVYARQRGLVYVDYTTVLATPEGAMKPELTPDGVHPRGEGYDLMEPLALKAIAEAERKRAHPGRRPRG